MIISPKFGVMLFAICLLLSTRIASAAGEMPFPPGEGEFNWQSFEQLKSIDLDDEQLTVFGPWLGPDQQLVENVLAYFAAATD